MEGFATAHGTPADGVASMVLVASRPGDARAAAASSRVCGPISACCRTIRSWNSSSERVQLLSTDIHGAVVMTLAFAFLLIATLLTMS